MTMLYFKTIRNHKSHRFSRGFTLLEVLVSLAIIATVLVSIMRLQGQTIAMNETVRFYSIAPFLAQSKMAEIRMDSQSFPGSDKGDFGSDFSEYAWEIRVEDQEVLFEEDLEMFFLDVLVTVRHPGWGLVYQLEGKLPGQEEGLSS